MQPEERSKEQCLILRSLGGLYLAETENGVVECHARGIFRKNKISPCAGDRAYLEYEAGEPVISELLPRKNQLIRPPAANIDCIIFVVSTCEPDPDLLLLDKFISVAEYKNILPALVITKSDLRQRQDIEKLYSHIGYKVFVPDYSDEHSVEPIKNLIAGKICILTGNTGAGKSTLLNHIDSSLCLATGDISKKLGRGKHTTRQASLYKLSNGGYIADTPGFSTFETNKYDIIFKDQLKYCFREFAEYNGKCRFPDCAHIKEAGCAVIKAVEDGYIAGSRHSSYCEMYEEAKQIKEWELEKYNGM